MYRGGEGQLAWILHRVTGVGVFLFLLAHIVDTALIGWGPEVYNTVMAIYHKPLFKVGEAILAGMVLYHALNGIRITVLDLWEELTRFHRQLFYVEVALFLVIFVPAAYIMLKPLF
jgi:succinate dehydrogenase / fumarate reductase cytochrome b subunit